MHICGDFKPTDRFFFMSDMGWMVGAMCACIPSYFGGSLLVAEGTPDYPDTGRFWRLLQDHRVSYVGVAPTLIRGLMRYGDEDVRLRYDLSSLRVVWHLAEPCPEWLKQCWIDWLGPERIMELYAGTEAQTATVITGAEWLAHRGSVGRVQPGTVMITDEDGNEVPTGEMGEVWMRSLRGTPTYRYVGATARTREGGWESLGDMGRLDEDGYLYLGDRASDMILSGGANIYPAEVESGAPASTRPWCAVR